MSVKTTAAIIDEIILNITTNGSNDITGVKLRTLLTNFADSFHNKTSDAYPAGVSEPTAKAGTAITFDKDYVHGLTAPESGAITISHTGAKVGTVVTMVHLSETDPFAALEGVQVIVGSYQTNQTNYLMFFRLSATIVLCTINQEQ